MLRFIIKNDNFLFRYRILLLSILLFIVIFFALGFPYVDWGFNFMDDAGLLWHSKVGSYKDYFVGFGARQLVNGSDYILVKESFFSVYYRPLTYFFYYLQSLVFGFSAYGFMLVNVFVHAVNSMLLFYIFTCYFPIKTSFISVLLFSFHPSLCSWLGWAAAQVYHLEIFFLLIIFLFFKLYFKSKRIFYYILSLFFYVFAILLREFVIIFPFWLFFSLVLYSKIKNISFNLKKHVLFASRFSSGFFVVLFVYLLLRLSIYPVGVSNLKLPALLFRSFSFEKLIPFCAHILNQSRCYLSSDFNVIRVFLSILLLFFFIFLFIKNTKKQYLLYVSISFLMFLWPSIVHQYYSSYFYMASPFYALFFLLLLEYPRDLHFFHMLSLKKVVYFFLFFLIWINFILIIYSMNCRESFLHKRFLIVKTIVDNIELQSRDLFFIGLPKELFFNGLGQELWLFGFSKNNKVFYNCKTVKPELFNEYYKNLKHKFHDSFNMYAIITWDSLTNNFKIIKMN